MKCSKCGKEIPDDAMFCAYCGQAVVVEEPDDKELTRPKAGRVLGGVVAGMSAYFGLSVMTLRIAWVLITICTVGLLGILYVVLYFAIPEEQPSA